MTQEALAGTKTTVQASVTKLAGSAPGHRHSGTQPQNHADSGVQQQSDPHSNVQQQIHGYSGAEPQNQVNMLPHVIVFKVC